KVPLTKWAGFGGPAGAAPGPPPPPATTGDGSQNSVSAPPAAPPRRTRNVLRIIREPFRCRVVPTTDLDRRETRLYETRYRGPAGWNRSPRSPRRMQLADRSPSPQPARRSRQTARYQLRSLPCPPRPPKTT